MKTLSACFTGHRASKMPYNTISKEHEKLENVLKEEITKQIRLGVSEFYCGVMNGIDELSALMIMHLEESLGTTANLNLVIPYKGIEKSYNDIQLEHFEWSKRRAKTVTVLHDKYVNECFRERNQYMIDRSDFLIAVQMPNDRNSVTQMAIAMAKIKGIEIRIINPISYEINVIKAKKPVNIFDE